MSNAKSVFLGILAGLAAAIVAGCYVENFMAGLEVSDNMSLLDHVHWLVYPSWIIIVVTGLREGYELGFMSTGVSGFSDIIWLFFDIVKMLLKIALISAAMMLAAFLIAFVLAFFEEITLVAVVLILIIIALCEGPVIHILIS